MTTQTLTNLKTLLDELDNGPFISMYFPVDKNPFNDKNRLVLKQLQKTATDEFAKNYPQLEWDKFEKQVAQISDELLDPNKEFPDSFGVITSESQQIVLPLNTEVEPIVNVCDWPNLLPYIAAQQMEVNFDLLALNQDSFELFEVNGGQVTKLEVADDAPTTLKKALGTELSGGETNFRSFTNGQGGGSGFHGHNTLDAEKEIDHRNYYQAVVDYLNDIIADRKRAVVLFALPENQSLFREICNNPYLSENMSVQKSPLNLSLSELADELAPVQEQWQAGLLNVLKGRYDAAQSQKLLLSDRSEILDAAWFGKIDTLMIKQNEIEAEPADWLLELTDQVLRYQGKVRIFPEEEYPAEEPVVAIARYK